MSAGHLAMAFDASFLLALALLITGCGLLKGNISAQVGALYPEGDAAGRTRGFSIFSMGINVGATAGPLVCGALAQFYGWHAGFGLAGILMLLGLATYTIGYRTLTEATPAANKAQPHARIDAQQWRTIAALFGVMLLSIFQSIAYYQNSNIGLIWINDHVDLNLLGFRVPVPWFNSIDSFISIVFVPPLVWLWRVQARRGGEPNEIIKISTGAWLAAFANLLLVIGCAIGPRVNAIFPVTYDIILGIAFLYYWPTLLALVSRTAPPAVKATMMGFVFLTLFLSNTIIGRLGAFYEQMTPLNFWAMHAAIAALGGTLALIANRPLSKLFAP